MNSGPSTSRIPNHVNVACTNGIEVTRKRASKLPVGLFYGVPSRKKRKDPCRELGKGHSELHVLQILGKDNQQGTGQGFTNRSFRANLFQIEDLNLCGKPGRKNLLNVAFRHTSEHIQGYPQNKFNKITIMSLQNIIFCLNWKF